MIRKIPVDTGTILTTNDGVVVVVFFLFFLGFKIFLFGCLMDKAIRGEV